MNESLNKILIASQKGYIDDIDEAERIVSNLARLPMTELDPKEECCIHQNIAAFLEELNLNEIDKNAVSYGEFLGIMDSFTLEPNADDKEVRLLAIKHCLINLLYAIRQNPGGNLNLKLFKAVTVKSYFGCISLKAGRQDAGIHNLYRRFRLDFRRATKFCMKDETTVSDFFEEVLKQLNTRWDIIFPIEEYKKRIEAVHDAVYDFFIDSFRIGFGEYLNNIQFIKPDTNDDFITINSEDDLF